MKYSNEGRFKPKACRACEATFTPTTPSQLYCNKKCRGRNAYYKRVYGIDEGILLGMKVAQNHKCFLCKSEGFVIGKNNHTEKLAVDHCHITGKVRSLLCHNCNRGLGLFKEQPELLRNAANYIEMYK